MTTEWRTRIVALSLAIAVMILMLDCRQKMGTHGHLRPQDASRFFQPQSTARTPPPHTVAIAKTLAEPQAQPPLTRELLKRGQERFDIYCAPCHGRTGEGNGMIVQRGFLAPPSYFVDRLRSAPDSHFYAVITEGFGAMYSYADRVSPEDRWAIIAYIRALQLSRSVSFDSLTPEEKAKVEEGAQWKSE